jgi:type IV secretion system protein VirD4
LVYLLPFYVGNKLAQIFRLLQGGDVIDRFIAVFSNLRFIDQQPLPSFNLQDMILGLIFAVGIKLIVAVKAQNRKKFRKGTEYGSARWGAYYQL